VRHQPDQSAYLYRKQRDHLAAGDTLGLRPHKCLPRRSRCPRRTFVTVAPNPAQAAAIHWPDIFNTPEAEAAKPRLVEQMRAVRPVVETG
jgi:hypothetical protein